MANEEQKKSKDEINRLNAFTRPSDEIKKEKGYNC